MAVGTIIVFEEAKEYLIDGGWEAADDIKCAVLDNSQTPTASFATPSLTDFTEVTAAGTYTSGGTSLGNLGTLVTEAGGVMKFDSATNPSFAADPSNDVDAWWALVYHVTSDKAILFMELDGPVDMVAGSLTLNWPAGGMFTIT